MSKVFVTVTVGQGEQSVTKCRELLSLPELSVEAMEAVAGSAMGDAVRKLLEVE